MVQQALYDAIRELEDRAATMSVPEPTPTADPRNQLIEADNYWRRGSLGNATGLYQEIAPSLPNSVEIYRRIALGLINSSRYAEAADFAERAINADPFNPEAWAIHAWALDWGRRAKEALVSALHALELDPDNSRAQAYLAEIYLSLGQAERAEALVEELLQNDPESAEGYRARGLIRQEYRYDFDGARQDFQTAYGMADNMNLYAVDIAILREQSAQLRGGAGLPQRRARSQPQQRSRLAAHRQGALGRLRQSGPGAALPAGLRRLQCRESQLSLLAGLHAEQAGLYR